MDDAFLSFPENDYVLPVHLNTVGLLLLRTMLAAAVVLVLLVARLMT